MINNIINYKNVKLYFILFLILLLLFFFLYLTNYYTKRENFQQNNNTEKNTLIKNINSIETPVHFLPTHQWTNTKSGLHLIDNPQEHYLYEHDDKAQKYDEVSSQFTSSFTCRPSITGVFTDCGPYSFNACGPIKPSTTLYNESKYRKHNYNSNKNDKNKNDKNKDQLDYDEYIKNLDGY